MYKPKEEAFGRGWMTGCGIRKRNTISAPRKVNCRKHGEVKFVKVIKKDKQLQSVG